MKFTDLTVSWLLLILTACSTPITSGTRTELPSTAQPLLVWGNHPAAEITALTWLKNRGLGAIDSTKLRGKQDVQAIPEVDLVKHAGDLGIQDVVLVVYTGDIRAPMVSIRALNTGNGALLWSGTARYPVYGGRPLNHALAVLTCQALSTAWGYREPGQRWFHSEDSACAVED